MSTVDVKQTVNNYRNACNELAQTVNDWLFDGSRSFYWVGEEVGGICDFDDNDFLKPEDMAQILEAAMTYDEYAEWRDANIENGAYINLASWLKGLRHIILKEQAVQNT